MSENRRVGAGDFLTHTVQLCACALAEELTRSCLDDWLEGEGWVVHIGW